MTLKIKVNDQEIEADVTNLPIKVEADGMFSQSAIIFVCNGQEYKLYVSKGGKLVTTK